MTYPQTPNALLTLRTANSLNWSEDMNRNLNVIDALIGAYFVVQNLQGVWENSHVYTVNQTVIDELSAAVYICGVAHTSAAVPVTFAQERAANPSYWAIYSSPARARGVWLSNTAYAINDFVTYGAQFAICVQTHVSSNSFITDTGAGKWSILVDFSAYGVMPDPLGNANAFTVINGLATDYELVAPTVALTRLGFTAAAAAFILLTDTTAMRAYLGVDASGSSQPLNSNLTSIAALTTTTFGRSLLTLAAAADLRTAAALGDIAVRNGGVANGSVPVMDAVGYPAASGAQITAVVAASVAAANVAAGNLGATVVPTLANDSNFLGADVPLTVAGTYFTGPQLTLGAVGKYHVHGTLTIQDATAGAREVFWKLWDGTTVYASGGAANNGGGASAYAYQIAYSGIVTNPAAAVRISVADQSSTTAVLKFNKTGESKDCSMFSEKIAS